MELSEGKFEILDHTVYEGKNMPVPLLIDRKLGLTDRSQALLHAANVIGANLIQQETDVRTLLERIAQNLSENEQNGVIVEDPDGKGSININPETTVVNIREAGAWKIATVLLFEMLHAWSETSEGGF